MLPIEKEIPRYLWLYTPADWEGAPVKGYWCICNLEITFDTDGTVLGEYISYDGGSPRRIISANALTIEEALVLLNDRIEKYEDDEIKGYEGHRKPEHPLFDKHYRTKYKWSPEKEDYVTPWYT